MADCLADGAGDADYGIGVSSGFRAGGWDDRGHSGGPGEPDPAAGDGSMWMRALPG
jgi:hypothetical protein